VPPNFHIGAQILYRSRLKIYDCASFENERQPFAEKTWFVPQQGHFSPNAVAERYPTGFPSRARMRVMMLMPVRGQR
jgi:hypothetical protein